MINRVTVREAFDFPEDKGIFYYIMLVAAELGVQLPWNDSVVDYATLDMEYMGNYSGSKIISPMLSMLITNGGLSIDSRKLAAKIIIRKYFKNWKRLWNVNVINYTPNENYNMIEDRTRGVETEEVIDGTVTTRKTGTDTLTHGKIETDLYGQKVTTEDKSRFGFNSSDPSPVDKTLLTEGSKQDSKTNSGNDTQTKNLTDTEDEDRTNTGSIDETERITRSGNIGVTTNQQMLRSELDLWKWNFWKNIFSDVDTVLSIQFYG